MGLGTRRTHGQEAGRAGCRDRGHHDREQAAPQAAAREWEITVVDRNDVHHYQPGYLFLAFGTSTEAQLKTPRHELLPDGVELVMAEIDRVDTEHQTVFLEGGGTLDYDYLVIASGTSPRPDQTPGMLGPQWRRSIFDFYTLDGAKALAGALAGFDHGRLVVHVTEMPIKCPVAPLEFTFLAEAWLREHGLRDRVEMVFVTPLPGAFTKPVASARLGGLLDERKIIVEPDFMVEQRRHRPEVPGVLRRARGAVRPAGHDPAQHGRRLRCALGAGRRAQLRPGRQAHVPAAPSTTNIFAVGDAADMPTSKAGSVAHFSVEIFVENFLRAHRGPADERTPSTATPTASSSPATARRC